jgi:Ser/Thr protein kinase RdoA (MazF antagonist)
MTANLATPYANLTPTVILDAIDSAGFKTSGGLFALNSYENRVYQVGIEDQPNLIAKFYRPNRWSDSAIIEEHQFALELSAREIPVIAPLVTNGQTLHHFQEFRFAVFAQQGGHTLELDNLEHLEWMGRFLGRLHAISACRKFQHRGVLTVESYGYRAINFLRDHFFIPENLREEFYRVTEILLTKISQRFSQAGNIAHIRLHGDCHAGNVLWNATGPKIVDLDDCLMGPAVQDLWMLLSGDDKNETRIQLDCILDGYSEFHDFNYREVYLIEALRALRLLHYSAWLAGRWEDPAFPLNFPWFNTQHYWQEQLNNLADQIDLLDDLEIIF